MEKNVEWQGLLKEFQEAVNRIVTLSLSGLVPKWKMLNEFNMKSFDIQRALQNTGEGENELASFVRLVSLVIALYDGVGVHVFTDIVWEEYLRDLKLIRDEMIPSVLVEKQRCGIETELTGRMFKYYAYELFGIR